MKVMAIKDYSTRDIWKFFEIAVAEARWPTSALQMLNDTPNSKLHSQFLNLTPNSWTSLRILEPHSKFQNLTPNSKISLRIQ